MCTPNFGASSIHIFRLLFLPLSITFRRIHERNSFDLGAICLFCFEFFWLIDFLIPVVTWWVLNLAIKILVAAVCGNAYNSFKRGGQLWLHNIFSVTHRITKETSQINLKLIKAYKYLVSYSIFFNKYSLALKIIWRLKNCCGRYLLERFIHSV